MTSGARLQLLNGPDLPQLGETCSSFVQAGPALFGDLGLREARGLFRTKLVQRQTNFDPSLIKEMDLYGP